MCGFASSYLLNLTSMSKHGVKECFLGVQMVEIKTDKVVGQNIFKHTPHSHSFIFTDSNQNAKHLTSTC